MTAMAKHHITRDDIMPMAEYAKVRRERRREMAETKKRRRLAVGPHATLYFENRKTMWMQIHEMLFIERGGDAQIEDELAAYNPLIPDGRELVATLMFEIPDETVRRRFLAGLGGVEECIELTVGDDVVKAVAEQDVDRTTAEGKASAVHFVHFPFTDAQARAFRDPATRVIVGITHPNYGHMAVMPPAMRAALADDLDP